MPRPDLLKITTRLWCQRLSWWRSSQSSVRETRLHIQACRCFSLLTPLTHAHNFLVVTVWKLRCQLLSSAGHICPIAQRHTRVVSQSSCRFLSVRSCCRCARPSAFPSLPVLADPSASLYHQPISRSWVISRQHHQCLDSMGGFVPLLLGAEALDYKIPLLSLSNRLSDKT